MGIGGKVAAAGVDRDVTGTVAVAMPFVASTGKAVKQARLAVT